MDLIKGCLVVMMVVYHSASSSPNAQVNLSVTHAIPFVHGGFVVVTGFLCGFHYWPLIRRSREDVVKRLLVSAAKLALVFEGCNIDMGVAGIGQDMRRFAEDMGDMQDLVRNCILEISEQFELEVIM